MGEEKEISIPKDQLQEKQKRKEKGIDATTRVLQQSIPISSEMVVWTVSTDYGDSMTPFIEVQAGELQTGGREHIGRGISCFEDCISMPHIPCR